MASNISSFILKKFLIQALPQYASLHHAPQDNFGGSNSTSWNDWVTLSQQQDMLPTSSFWTFFFFSFLFWEEKGIGYSPTTIICKQLFTSQSPRSRINMWKGKWILESSPWTLCYSQLLLWKVTSNAKACCIQLCLRVQQKYKSLNGLRGSFFLHLISFAECVFFLC